MRFEFHTPKSLTMQKPLSLFCCENPAILACDAKYVHFDIERREMLAIRTLAAVWPAMRAPTMQIASDVGRAIRTTKGKGYLRDGGGGGGGLNTHSGRALMCYEVGMPVRDGKRGCLCHAPSTILHEDNCA